MEISKNDISDFSHNIDLLINNGQYSKVLELTIKKISYANIKRFSTGIGYLSS